MKKLILLSVILIGCVNPDGKRVSHNYSGYNIGGFEINQFTIDSCEYVGVMNCGNANVLTHKGNCKYCIERNKK